MPRERSRISWNLIDNQSLKKLMDAKRDIIITKIKKAELIPDNDLLKQKEETENIAMLLGTNEEEYSVSEKSGWSIGGYSLSLLSWNTEIWIQGTKESWATQPKIARIEDLIKQIEIEANLTCHLPSYSSKEPPMHVEYSLRISNEEIKSCYKTN